MKTWPAGQEMRDAAIGDHTFEETVEGRDLGVLITETLSPSHHIARIVRKANQVVGMIRRTYEDRSNNNLVPLYKCLVTSLRVEVCTGMETIHICHKTSTT